MSETPTRKRVAKKASPPAAAATPTLPPLKRALEAGDRGPAIIAAQERLTELGHYDGKISGVFGYMTVKAVRRLQGAHGLRPSGIIDAPTYSALYGGN